MRPATLLDDMRQFMSQQVLSGFTPAHSAGTEHDVRAERKGVRGNRPSSRCGDAIRVDTNSAEIMTKARFEKVPRRGIEWMALLAQHFIYDRGCVRQPVLARPFLHLLRRIVAGAVRGRARPGFRDAHDLIGKATSVVFQRMVAPPDRQLGVLGE